MKKYTENHGMYDIDLDLDFGGGGTMGERTVVEPREYAVPLGTGLLTAPSRLYLKIFLPAAPFFLFCSAKKGSLSSI